MDDDFADSCAISPTAYLLFRPVHRKVVTSVINDGHINSIPHLQSLCQVLKGFKSM